MTNDYKKLLVEYLTGLLVEEQEKPTDFSPYYQETGYRDYNGTSFEDLVIALRTKNVVINGILDNDNYTACVVYGSYQDANNTNSKGFIFLCDTTSATLRPEKYYFLNCRGIQWLGFDEESNRVYGITSNKANNQNSADNDTYFSYFNNLFLAINDGFTPEQTYATKIWSDNDNVFMAREVIKDSGGSNYLIIGTNYINTNNISVISLKINVGQENELVVDTLDSDYYLCAVRGWYTNNNPYFRIIALNDNVSPLKFALISGTINNASYVNLNIDQAIDPKQTLYIHPEWQVVSDNEIYFIYNAVASSKKECCIYKYNGNSIETIYKTFNGTGTEQSLTPMFNLLQDYDGTLYLVKYIMKEGDGYYYQTISYTNFTKHKNELDGDVWTFPEEIGIMTTGEAYNMRAVCKRSYNIMWLISLSGYMRDSFGSANGDIIGSMNYFDTEIVQDGYTGDPYTTRFSLIPKYARLSQFLPEQIRFSRNFYNVSTNNNITTSSMEVPNNYLNASGIQIYYNSLVGDTGYSLISKNQPWTKNVYEVVHVNFINTLNVIDEDTNTYYVPGGVRINYATNVMGLNNYTYSKCTKYRINYVDGTNTTGDLNWQPINNTNKKVKFTIYVDKAIKNIDLISYDGSTIYMTINGTFTIGKFYTINQKVRVGEKPQEDNLQYNGENVLYNNEQVMVYTQ